MLNFETNSLLVIARSSLPSPTVCTIIFNLLWLKKITAETSHADSSFLKLNAPKNTGPKQKQNKRHLLTMTGTKKGKHEMTVGMKWLT
jgi:hypothetical protein